MEGPAPECLPLGPPRPCHHIAWLEAEFFHPLVKTTGYFSGANFSATFCNPPPPQFFHTPPPQNSMTYKIRDLARPCSSPSAFSVYFFFPLMFQLSSLVA